MSAYRIVVSKRTYSKTDVGDYVKVGKDDSGVTLYCKVFSKECHPSNNEWVLWTGTKFYYWYDKRECLWDYSGKSVVVG